MRFALAVPRSAGDTHVDAVVADARTAEAAGFDLVWVDAGRHDRTQPGPLAVAAALAPHLRGISVGAVVEVGATDAIDDVEDLAMAGQVLDGRLVTCLRPASGAEASLDEAVDVVLAGLDRIEPTVWVAGTPARAVAASHGLSYVAESPADGAASWPMLEAALGRRVLRLRRPGYWPVVLDDADGDLDIHAMTDELAAAQRAWGLDTAILTLPSQLDESGRREVIWRIAHDVRPRVQLDRLPAGLAEYWDDRMAVRLASGHDARFESTRPTGGDDG
jgi:hypothetical protein